MAVRTIYVSEGTSISIPNMAENISYHVYLVKFTLFIPCIIDNYFTTLNQRYSQTVSLDIYITLNIPTCFDPQGTFCRESNESYTA